MNRSCGLATAAVSGGQICKSVLLSYDVKRQVINHQLVDVEGSSRQAQH